MREFHAAIENLEGSNLSQPSIDTCGFQARRTIAMCHFSRHPTICTPSLAPFHQSNLALYKRGTSSSGRTMSLDDGFKGDEQCVHAAITYISVT